MTRDVRPAHVEQVGDGLYVVTGICVGDLPATKPARHMRIMRLDSRVLRHAAGSGVRWALDIEGGPTVYGATLRALRIEASQHGADMDSNGGQPPHNPDEYRRV